LENSYSEEMGEKGHPPFIVKYERGGAGQTDLQREKDRDQACNHYWCEFEGGKSVVFVLRKLLEILSNIQVRKRKGEVCAGCRRKE